MNHYQRIMKRSPVEVATIAAMILVLGYLGLPAVARATAAFVELNDLTRLEVAAMQNETQPFGSLPFAGLRGPTYAMTVTATAYNSLPDQTDSTPFITASGSHVRFGVLAANFLPIGTMVRIPDVYGDQMFVVEDRMNPRYHKRVDIWMEGIDEARAFGVRNITIEVYDWK